MGQNHGVRQVHQPLASFNFYLEALEGLFVYAEAGDTVAESLVVLYLVSTGCDDFGGYLDR